LEKNAMPTIKQIAAGLGIGATGLGTGTALGALGGSMVTGPIAGGAGYYLGKRKDKQTPFHGGHVRYAHGKGRQRGRAEVVHALRQRMASAQARGKTKKAFVVPAALGGTVGLVNAPQGRKMEGAAGGALGGVGGAMAGGLAGGAAGGLAGGAGLGSLGALGGGLAGGAAGMQAGGGRLAALGALGGAVAGGLGGAGAGAVLGGGAGGLAGQLGGAALGGYAGERLMNPRPRRKKKSVSVGKGKSKLEITVKKASEVSDSALIAAAQVLEMRKSAHVNLRIPEYVLGY
jgi:hypothetical protein